MSLAMPSFNSVAVIGAGAWGTALSEVCARAGREVVLWAREPEVRQSIAERRENSLFLPGVPLSDAVSVTGDFAALAGAERLAAGLKDGLDAVARPRWPLDEAAALASPTHLAGRKGAKA